MLKTLLSHSGDNSTQVPGVIDKLTAAVVTFL